MGFEICNLERILTGERDDWPIGMKEEKMNGGREEKSGRVTSDSKKRRE